MDKALLDLLMMLLLLLLEVLEFVLFAAAPDDEERAICLYSLIDSLVRRISLIFVSQSHL